MPEIPPPGAPVDLRDTEPHKTLIDAMERLQGQGHDPDEVAEAALELAVTLSAKLHGPGAVAARLLKLAGLFAAQAEQHITVDTGRMTH